MKRFQHRFTASPLAAAALAALLAAGGAFAQTASEEPMARDTVEVQETLLDVIVKNGNGEVVPYLDEKDFRVLRDGEPVEITSATYYSLPAGADSMSAADGEALGARHFVLLFHDQRLLLPRLGAQQLEAGHWAARWAKGDLTPRDRVVPSSLAAAPRAQGGGENLFACGCSGSWGDECQGWPLWICDVNAFCDPTSSGCGPFWMDPCDGSCCRNSGPSGTCGQT